MANKEVVRQIWIAPMDEREVTLTVFDLVNEFTSEAQQKALIDMSLGALHDHEEVTRVNRERLDAMLSESIEAYEVEKLERRNHGIVHFMESAKRALRSEGYDITVTDGREWLCLWAKPKPKVADKKTFLWGEN